MAKIDNWISFTHLFWTNCHFLCNYLLQYKLSPNIFENSSHNLANFADLLIYFWKVYPCPKTFYTKCHLWQIPCLSGTAPSPLMKPGIVSNVHQQHPFKKVNNSNNALCLSRLMECSQNTQVCNIFKPKAIRKEKVDLYSLAPYSLLSPAKQIWIICHILRISSRSFQLCRSINL